MRIAILGSTSQIAKDLILTFANNSQYDLVLYSRRPEAVTLWLIQINLAQHYKVADFAAFTINEHFDAIINFVGVGNPAQAAVMGASIFDVTLKYDDLALGYLSQHPTCRYLFLSSGAVYGSSFETPVNTGTKAVFDINNLKPQDWYGVAKLYAECRHRALTHLSIVDIRIFNYFSKTQDIEARFLISDILRAIRDKRIFQTTADYIIRDYLHPLDFYQLVCILLDVPQKLNTAIDCYSKKPIDKQTILSTMKKTFGLEYEICEINKSVNATGTKPVYHSMRYVADRFGYNPMYTSLDCILLEAEMVLDRFHQKNK